MNLDIAFAPTVSAYMQSDARHRLIVGPFGSGKTIGSLTDIVRRAAMQQKSSIDGKRKSRWAVVRNTMPQLKDTTLKSWLEWYPNGSLGWYKETGKTYFIKQDDIEAEVIFRALDDAADVKNLLSLDLTGAVLAEYREIDRDIFQALDGRIGRYPRMIEGGPTWVGIWGDSNAPEEESYWAAMMEKRDPDDYKTKKNNGLVIFRQPAAMLKNEYGQYVLNPLAENLKNLPADYYQNLVKDKTEDFIRVNVLVEYGRSKGGRPVHPEFNRDIHVAKGVLIPNRDLVLLIAADFGLTPAMALKQQDAFGRVLTLDEVVCFDMGLERAIETKLLPLMRRKYEGFDILVTGDPSGVNRAQGNEVSCVDIFKGYKRQLGRVRMASTNAPLQRREATDHFLIPKQPPTYLVDPGCEVTIQAMSGKFMYKKTKDGRHSEEVEKNDWSHTGEANEYGDMWFKEGRRRKAEPRPHYDGDWAEARAQQGQGSNIYVSPR